MHDPILVHLPGVVISVPSTHCPQKDFVHLRPFEKKKIGLLFSEHVIKELQGLYCSATYRPLSGFLQSQHENGCRNGLTELLMINLQMFNIFKPLLASLWTPQLAKLQKEKNQNQKDFGWSTSTAHIFCKGWLARAACQLVVVTQKSWFLAALRDLLPTMT